MIRVPTVETERLRLRGPRLSDVGHLAGFFQTPRSKLVGGPKTRAQAFGVPIGMRLHWLRHGFGYWIIELKDTGQPIGATGIAKFGKTLEPELGVFVYGGFSGEDYGLEASRAARDYSAANLGVYGVASFLDPKNERAVHVVKKLGARFEREAVVQGQPCHLYRHPSAAASQSAGDTANVEKPQDRRPK